MPCTSNIILLKDSLNSDGHQFHQYQENEQSPLIRTLNTTPTCDVGNPGHDLWQAHNLAGLNRLMDSKPFPFDNWISNGNTYINKYSKGMWNIIVGAN